MGTPLSDDHKATVAVLLHAGKSINEISKFVGLDREAVGVVARSLDIEPTSPTQKRAKALFADTAGNSYQAIAAALRRENLTNDNGKPVHYLTISTWANNHGWKWGGSPDGTYVAPSAGANRSATKYSLRISKTRSEELNASARVAAAADAAWHELDTDRTTIVQLAVIRGAAASDVTDLDAVRKALLAKHGEAIRNARV